MNVRLYCRRHPCAMVISHFTFITYLYHDSYMILRDRVHYAKRSYIFSEKTAYFQHFADRIFKPRIVYIQLQDRIFSAWTLSFTGDPTSQLTRTGHNVFSECESGVHFGRKNVLHVLNRRLDHVNRLTTRIMG